MRFDRIQIARFGRVRDLDTGPEPLPDLVVVAGPNEAGKSTFFRMLTALLYGFAPANRDQNPDAPWGGEEAEGRAWLRSSEHGLVQVHRKLRNTPWGRLLRDELEEDIRNRAVDLVDRLPRTVFRQVFALTLSEVAALEAGNWAEVQDRLVSAMGARDVVPPRDAADRLEEEAGALWRPNKRGKQVVRILGDEIRDLEATREEALRRDVEIRGLDEQLRTGQVELERLVAERMSIEAQEERLARLLPVHRQLRRIAELEAEGGNPDALAGLPADTLEGLAALRERVATLAARVHEMEALEGTLRENVRRAESLSDELFGRTWDGDDRQALRRVGATAVRARISEFMQARDARRMAEAAAATTPPPAVPAGPPRWVGGVASALGVAGLAFGLASGNAVWSLMGAAAATTGFWLLRRLRTPNSTSPEVPRGPALPSLREQESAARDALDASLGALRLRRELVDQPTMELPALLQRLQELERDVESQMALASDVSPVLAARPQAELEPGQLTLGFAAGADDPSDPVAESTSAPPARITDVATAAARLVAGRDRARTQLTEAGAAKGALEARLSLLGEGDPDRGVLEAIRRLTAVRTAADLNDELRRSHADLPALRSEIDEAAAAEEPWTYDPQAPTALKHRRVMITREIEGLGRTLERRQQGLHRLLELPTADRIEGEILSLKDRRIAVARDRDRKMLLARLIRLADQRFRQERQPRVLRRAGEYLATITGNRYDRIITAEEDGREVFKLMGDGRAHPASLDRSASTGTREQAYLALRLAAVDELDGGGERLPVFVDEVFVNWDEERRARGIELLGQLSTGRQVFVFTCHGDVADAFERLGGRVIRLEAGQLRTLEGAT